MSDWHGIFHNCVYQFFRFKNRRHRKQQIYQKPAISSMWEHTTKAWLGSDQFGFELLCSSWPGAKPSKILLLFSSSFSRSRGMHGTAELVVASRPISRLRFPNNCFQPLGWLADISRRICCFQAQKIFPLPFFQILFLFLPPSVDNRSKDSFSCCYFYCCNCFWDIFLTFSFCRTFCLVRLFLKIGKLMKQASFCSIVLKY